ncbi:MAG: DUF1566 domain-containing protein [Planctomycetota bacterium]|nr:DUF1566 domain-containing protein [Planctomycetota bacterium]
MKRITVILVPLALLAARSIFAAGLDSPAPPADSGSAMYSLTDIYNRLNDGTVGAKRTGAFTEPSASPAKTGFTLDQIMAKLPARDDSGGALPSQVLSGKTFWGLLTTGWGPQPGTMPNRGAVTITPSATSQSILLGFHNGSGTVSGDVDLVSGNIRSGISIFGVSGDPNVVDTSGATATASDIILGKKAWAAGSLLTGTAPLASLPKTGNTASIRAGEDGILRKGVAWPNPRFTDNGDGTVTDNLTKLIWMKKANPINAYHPLYDQDDTVGDGQVTWEHAMAFIDGMNAGTYTNLGHTDWRVPNVKEMLSLIHYMYRNPALPNTAGTGQWTDGNPFSGVPSVFNSTESRMSTPYWTSTRDDSSSAIWGVGLWYGAAMSNKLSTDYWCVWPVRGGP